MISLVANSHSIRWRPGQKEKLEALAAHCGLEVVDVIRNAADAVIKYAAAHGGVVPFPLDFEVGFTPRPLEHGRLILHEPPRAQSKPVRAGDGGRTNRPARKAISQG